MTVIGVLTDTASRDMANTLRDLLISDGVPVVIVDGIYNISKWENPGTEAAIIPMNKDSIIPVVLDILILDNCDLISYELIECISPETRLIYNGDKSHFRFEHQNAISYGMAYNADVTVSSIDDKCDGISFVLCLQRPVLSLNGNWLYEGEFQVQSDNTCINELLPAITCTMLCDIFAIKKTKN